MQVTIRVTRTLGDGTIVHFEGQADSVEGAIKAAAQMAGTQPVAPATTVEDVARDARSAAVLNDAVAAGVVTKAEVKTKTAEVKPDAELEKAVTQVEEAAKETPVDDGLTELSYTADVRPVLLKLNKAKGADTLKALLKKFGAANGDKLTADQFVAVLADANAQLAA